MPFYTETFDAIGVANQVTVCDPDALEEVAELARRELAELDRACSRFRDDSELALLNRSGTGTVSPLLFDLLEAALDAAATTDGIVDPTIGASLRALGYDRDFDVVVRGGAAPLFEVRPASGWRSVALDAATSSVRLSPGTELDLGATAKAFASDCIATAAFAATGSSVLVSLGGDISVAGPAPDGGWPVLVTDDSRARGAVGQTIGLRAGGLATSGTTVRRWRAGDVEVHHIVDPRTGAPAAEAWRTVSVTAATCLDANVAATAAIVFGFRAPRWLEERRFAARLVRPNGEIVAVGGWPVDEPLDKLAA
jgi:FAD:protein FMN transferase